MKYPFTTAGLQDLLLELYQQSDSALQIEANALLLDFKSWVAFHFELSESQLAYLDNLNGETTRFTAFITSFAVQNRLPVYLDKADLILKGEPILKVIEPQSNIAVTENSNGDIVTSGNVTVKISYQN